MQSSEVRYMLNHLAENYDIGSDDNEKARYAVFSKFMLGDFDSEIGMLSKKEVIARAEKIYDETIGDNLNKIMALCGNLHMFNIILDQLAKNFEQALDDKNKEIKALHMLIEVQDERS